MRQGPVLLRAQAARPLDLDQHATPAATVTSQALDLRPVAQGVVPRNRRRDHRVVAVRQVVLGGLPQEPPATFGEIYDARDRCRRTGGRDRSLAGIPRPSRPLLLWMGSVGPIGSLGVSMSPWEPRAVPHGRP